MFEVGYKCYFFGEDAQVSLLSSVLLMNHQSTPIDCCKITRSGLLPKAQFLECHDTSAPEGSPSQEVSDRCNIVWHMLTQSYPGCFPKGIKLVSSNRQRQLPSRRYQTIRTGCSRENSRIFILLLRQSRSLPAFPTCILTVLYFQLRGPTQLGR